MITTEVKDNDNSTFCDKDDNNRSEKAFELT
jgi:hypothetical protein